MGLATAWNPLAPVPGVQQNSSSELPAFQIIPNAISMYAIRHIPLGFCVCEFPSNGLNLRGVEQCEIGENYIMRGFITSRQLLLE
jgi:hypothetical protein